MYDIFQTRKVNYNLRSETDFASICVSTNSLGMVPLEIKTSGSVEIF